MAATKLAPVVAARPKKVKMQLIGSDGNAFSIMGRFQRAAKKQGWTPEQIKVVLSDCMAGDYNHLLKIILDNVEEPTTY